jgi:beta-galactosidase
LTADRTTVQAAGQDLSFVTVEALDAHGRLQPNADQHAQFTINGPGAIAAVGNGDGQDSDSHQGHQRKLFHGRAVVVVRTSKEVELIRLTATAPGLSDGLVTIHANPTASRADLR